MKYALITLFALTLTACSFTRETSKISETKTETETQRLRTTFSDLSEFITITLPELPTPQPVRDSKPDNEPDKPEPKQQETMPEPAPPVFAGLPAGTRIEIRREERTRETEQEETATREETREETEEKVDREIARIPGFWVALLAVGVFVALLVVLTLLRRF